jgi:hypothetical protein
MSDSINALIAGQHNASVIDSLANPPQINMLGSISRATEAAKGVLSLRAAKAQQAWGNALQQATDPKTGAVDYPHAQAIAAQDPDAVMGMETGLASSSGRMDEQVNRGHALNGWLQGAAAALPLNPTRQQVLDMLNKGGAAGIIPSDILAKEIATVPTDEKQIPTFVQQLRDSALSAEQNFKLHYGIQGTLNQGGQVIGTNQSPYTGAVTPSGSGIPLGLTPEQWNAPVQGYRNPDTGQPEAITQGQLLQRLKLAPPGNYGTGAPAPGTAAPPAPAPSTTTTPPVPPVPTAPRPDDEARWKASTDLYSRDKEATTNYQQRIFPLAQVSSILASGDVTTGQGAEALNRAKSFLMTAGANLGFDMDKLAKVDKFDELAKYMQQYVNAQGMSARSDQALASAITGNASAHLNTLANKEVVKPLLAMERMKQMAMQDFEKTDGHPQNYSRFLNDWQNTHDPRAFMADLLSKEQYTQMVNKMTDTERQRFSDTLHLVETTPGIMTLATMPH